MALEFRLSILSSWETKRNVQQNMIAPELMEWQEKKENMRKLREKRSLERNVEAHGSDEEMKNVKAHGGDEGLQNVQEDFDGRNEEI